ncbi:MAG: ATP-binding protein [Marinomonas sp.]
MAKTTGSKAGADTANSQSAEQSKAAEQRLSEARTFQELIFKHIPDLIFVKDEEFRIVQANEHFLGVYPEDMRDSILGTTTIEQYNEEERNAFLVQDKIAFDEGISEVEESIDFPDGARRTLLTRKVRFEDSQDNKFVLGIGRDITELVDARKEKEFSLALLNSVFDTVSGAIIGLNADRQVVMINNAGRHMLGEDSAEVPFAWPREIGFLDPEDMQPLESSHDPVARALIGQEIGGEVHLMTRRSSEDARYIRVTSRMVHNDSSPLHSVIVLDDVSEAERNRQQIERQSRLDALGQLTGGIAHDFNNLLNTMQFAIELIRRDNLSERGLRSANAAMNSIARGSELTGRLLAFAKKQPERAHARSLSETFAELKELAAPSIEASVTVEFGTFEEELLAFCDQGQLQNAVLNLILNSRDAIMEAGQGNAIKIGARAVDFLPTGISAASEQRLPSETEGRISQGKADAARNDGHAQRYIEISVSDNGPGMSKAVASRALDPFFTTKLVNSGTGLGLSMVYGFVQQSDGEMRIYSEEGHGTTVRMFLPRGNESTGLEEPFALAPLSDGKGETILIAEDEEFLRDQLGELLKELKYNVLEAESGRDAVAMLKAGAKPDLILTDVVMPGGIGGFELARLAREIMPLVPIIYMSGYTGFTDEEMGAVIAPLLPKPSSPSVISGQLRAALGDTEESS